MIKDRNILIVIPARGQSKRLPGKNIKKLAGKPLIEYTIDCSRALSDDENICVSTEDPEIIRLVESKGLKVPFIRPASLASDTASSDDVLLHAVNFYEQAGRKIDILVLLQPTSPLRKPEHVIEALKLYNEDLDMVVSVKKSHANTLLCSETKEGFLKRNTSMADPDEAMPKDFYEYNGAIYVINVEALKAKSMSGMTRVRKYLMDKLHSIDIDDESDFAIAQSLLA